MVKCETDEGRPVFIKPEAVASIGPSGIDGCSSVNAGIFYCIKGTPDEVHAKLFPPTPVILDAEAARVVLEWAADPRGAWRPELEHLAKKALGL